MKTQPHDKLSPLRKASIIRPRSPAKTSTQLSTSLSKYVEPSQVETCVKKLDHAYNSILSVYTKEEIQRSNEEVLYSFGFFLELCNLFNVKNINKNELILMMKGRILPCIKREPAIAPSIIIENLHQYIFDEACPHNGSAQCGEWFARLMSSVTSKNELDMLENRSIVDARDYQISIDNQLWCFKATIRSLLQEDHKNIRFVEPLGPLTLAVLLQGEEIPYDEVTEHQIILKIQNKKQQLTKTKISNSKVPLQKKLQSIFSFVPDSNENAPVDHPICRMVKKLNVPSSTVYQLALEQTCRMHFAIRTLVSLSLHLGKLSVERKKFVFDGALEVLFLLSISNNLPEEMIERNLTDKSSSSPNQASISLVTFEFFQQMAHSGVVLFHEEEILAVLRYHQHQQLLARKDHSLLQDGINNSFLLRLFEGLQMPVEVMEKFISTTMPRLIPFLKSKSTSSSNPRSQYVGGRQSLTQRSEQVETNSIERRLLATRQAATKQYLRETKKNLVLEKQQELDQSCQRQRVRQLIDQADHLRMYFHQSLELLRTGRLHPNPNLCFVDWINSFSTMETKYQDHLLQKEQDEQEEIQKNRKKDEEKVKEREELKEMKKNDFTVLSQEEKIFFQKQKEHFRQFFYEKKQLEIQLTKDQFDEKIAQNFENQRLGWIQKQKEEIKKQEIENLFMRQEDLLYILRILETKKNEEKNQMKMTKSFLIQEERKKIDKMRQKQYENQKIQQEITQMEREERLSLKCKLFQEEQTRERFEKEANERLLMKKEERDTIKRWKLLEEEAKKNHEEIVKRQKADERRRRRRKQTEKNQQQHQIQQGNAQYYYGQQQSYDDSYYDPQQQYYDGYNPNQQQSYGYNNATETWIQCQDEYGNIYYYNQMDGTTQWEKPLSYTTSTTYG